MGLKKMQYAIVYETMWGEERDGTFSLYKLEGTIEVTTKHIAKLVNADG